MHQQHRGGRVGERRHDGLDPKLELHIDWDALGWDVLPEALKMGKTAEEDWVQTNLYGTLPNRAVKKRRRRPEDRLRAGDSW